MTIITKAPLLDDRYCRKIKHILQSDIAFQKIPRTANINLDCLTISNNQFYIWTNEQKIKTLGHPGHDTAHKTTLQNEQHFLP